MSKSDELFLVTYEFPFGRSETFLEVEIEVLAKNFSKVWVMPSRSAWISSGSHLLRGPSRPVPDNCDVVVLRRNILGGIGFGVLNAWRLLLAAEFERSTTLALVRQAGIVLRDVLKVSLLANELRNWISTVDAKRFGYAYWKSEAATTLAVLKQRGEISGFVSRCHGGDLYHEIEKRIYRPFDGFTFAQSSWVAPVSQHGCDYLIERGVDRSKVDLARLGVRLLARPSFASDDGVLRVMSCSNAIPVKRLNLLAAALARLDVPFEWTHFGDGPELPKIREMARSFPRQSAAVFRGRTSNETVLEHYRSHPVDVFINVSLSEGVPVSIMEALSAGVPCIATDVGGTAEIVDEICGRLLASTVTVDDLAQQIKAVATERESWRQRRAGARRRATSRCNAEVNYADFCARLRSCVTQSTTP
ncbi:MAG: glycosyltransferase [Lautropia sp.]